MGMNSVKHEMLNHDWQTEAMILQAIEVLRDDSDFTTKDDKNE